MPHQTELVYSMPEIYLISKLIKTTINLQY